MISEAKREEIRREAKEILDGFGNALKKIKMVEFKGVVGKESVRVEGNGEMVDKNFRKIVFDNAPEKDEDYIYAEKKGW